MDATARRIADWLRSIRSTARTMLVAQRLGWIVAGAVLAVIVGGFADYFLRAPVQLRTMGLVLAVAALVGCVARFLLPAFRFRPSLTEIALRVENSGVGLHAKARGLLASGLELGRHPEGLAAPALAAPVVAEAAERLTAIKAREVFSPRPTIRSVGAAVAVFLLFFGLTATWPQHTQIGMARMLWPWGSAEWPKRTEITDATHVDHHPLGTALPLRALLLRSDRPIDKTRMSAHYRVITDGSSGPERSVLLTDQNQTIAATLTDGTPTSGTLFERLIEPTGLASGSASRTDAALVKTELEYWFESDDDATKPQRILLIDPPAVVRASAQITLPEYAAKILGSAAGVAGSQKVDLGPGSDDRAAPAPILAGSRVSVTLEFNKPLPVIPSLDPAKNPGATAWIQSTLGPEAPFLFSHATTGPSPEATLTGEGRTWTLSWQHWESVRLIVKPTDEYQIAAGEDAAFRFDALKDNPPTASVTTPAEDKSVLPTAVVEIAGEARDDVALAWVALERQLARKNPTSESSAPEAAADRVEITRLSADAANPDATPGDTASVKRLVSTLTLDLTTIPDLKTGDELWITALAADAFELGGQKHEPVRSTIRKLKILSREQLVEQIWSELGTLRRTAIKIDQDQTDIAKAKPPAGPAGEEASARAERAQAGLTERLSRQNAAVDRLKQRVKENGLTDQSTNDVLKQATEALNRAGEHSAESAKKLGEASRNQSQEGAEAKAGEKELDKSADEQKAVRDELANLIDMLDQGEDSFTAQRAVDRLIDQQKALQTRTGETGRQTAGKSPEQLTPEQKDALDKVAQDQKALADQLRETVKKMQDREQKLRKNDPAAAQAMADAAAQSMRDQTPERMDQAGKQAENNQTSSAQQQQEQAIQSLEQMKEKLQQAQNNKDEVLKRALASLIDSLKALIEVQQISINALKEASPKGSDAIVALENSMVLLHQNTLGVLDQASAVRDLGSVSTLIEKASAAMANAIPELREARAEPALDHEVIALGLLKDAKDEAERLEKAAAQRQNAKKRADLRGKYEAALKTQLGLEDSTQGIVGAEDSRRTKALARSFGQDQAALKEVVDQIRRETGEVTTAKVFNYAHDRLDSLMDAVVVKLNGGSADAAAVRNQTSAARLLKSLAEALDDSKKPDDPFRSQEDQSGGGSGSGGEQPLVPDSAEVILLRLMQQEALDLSRNAADGKQADSTLVDDAGRLQRELAEQGSALLKRLTEKQSPKPAAPKPAKNPDDKPAPKDAPEKPDGEGGPQ